MKLSEAIEFWLKTKQEQGLEKGTLKMYNWAMNRFRVGFVSMYGNKDLDKIQVNEVLLYLQKLKEGSKHHTHKYIKTRIKLFFKDNDLDKIANKIKFKPTRGETKMIAPIKEEELQLILRFIDQTDDKVLVKYRKSLKAMVVLFYSSGLRNFEMRNLIIGDLDFKNYRGKTISKWVDKSIKLDFVFSHQAADYIKEYVGERINNKNDYVFVDLNGKKFKYFRTWELFDRIRQGTNINIWQHRFRHAFSTDLIKKHGMRPKQAMLLTRHKHIASFERYLDEEHEEVVNLYHKKGGLEIHEIDKAKQNKQDEQTERQKP